MSLILRRILTLEPGGATEPILAWTARSGRGRQDGSSRGTGAGRSRGHGSVAGRSDAHRVGRGRQYPGGYCCVFLLHSAAGRSEEHTSELQSLMRISYAVFCLKKKNTVQQL